MWQRWREHHSASFLLVRVYVCAYSHVWARVHHGMRTSWHVSEGRRTALDVSSHLLPCSDRGWLLVVANTGLADPVLLGVLISTPSHCSVGMQWLRMHTSTSGSMWVFRIHTPVLLLAWCMLYLQKHLSSQKGNACFNEDRSACLKKKSLALSNTKIVT